MRDLQQTYILLTESSIDVAKWRHFVSGLFLSGSPTNGDVLVLNSMKKRGLARPTRSSYGNTERVP